MDPVSQMVVGAACAQLLARRASLGAAAVVGALGGLAPDVDVFIRSTSDPLLALEYHRHFTHALLFIPIGGLICATVFYGLIGRWRGMLFKGVWLWATVGYASHGLLDACTSYGTQLFWPFSDRRVSFDIISVIDPLFTLPLAAAVLIAGLRRRPVWLAAGCIWAGVYLMLGLMQHERAVAQGMAVAEARGHAPERVTAKPSFANLMVWKVIYQHEGRFYVLAVRPGFGRERIWPGDSIAVLNLERDLPWLEANSQQARDVDRFRWFSDDYIGLDPANSRQVVDIRYSLVPDQIAPLWGIHLDPAASPEAHADYYSEHNDRAQATRRLWQMIVQP